MKTTKLLLMGALALGMFASCDDDESSTTTTPTSTDVVVSGEITSDVNWTKDNVYVLNGRVSVTSGATLSIQAGTVIKANPGAAAFASALVISSEGKIMAEGTADEPIIFTTVADDLESGAINSPNMDALNNGLWGGVIILGKAPISAKNDAAQLQIEGIPTSDQNGLYGGTESTHSSGVFKYVSIRHGGTNIGAGNEINGLTLGGVGSGTEISNIEIVANQDDGIEWFGGTVSLSNVLVWNCGDDGLDTDQDWVGTCNNFLVVTPQGGSAFELDGPEGNSSSGNAHMFINGTVYAGENIDHLVDWDGSTNAALSNVYFYGLSSTYGYVADDPNTADDDEEFNPFESFGGDGSGTSQNLEIKLGGGSLADLFAPGTTLPAELTAVSAGTVGADASVFGWTWASKSGALAGIGQ